MPRSVGSYRALTTAARFGTPEALSRGDSELMSVRSEEIETRGVGAPLDEAGLAHALERALAENAARPRADSDVEFSVLVRSTLPLSRRAASDRLLWSYLNAVVAWPYVSWRWRNDATGQVDRNRVLGALDRSALARLWWMAELCRDREPEVGGEAQAMRSRLQVLLASQDRAVQLYERPRLLMRPVLGVGLLAPRPARGVDDDKFRDFARRCRARFGVLLPGAMTRQQIESLLDELWNEMLGA